MIDEVTVAKVVFQFPTRLLLQNNTKTISSLTIYDGQSQTITLAPGGSFTATYQTSGVKTLSFRANFSNGTTQTVQSTLTVNGVAGTGSMSIMGTEGIIKPVIYPCDPPIMTYRASTPFADYITGASKYGEGEIGYYYASCSTMKER